MVNNGKSHICSLDGRRFSTRRALAQHRQAAHQGAQTQARRQPAGTRRGRAQRPVSSKECRRVKGSDIIGTVSVTKANKAGDVVFATGISPRSFESTRLQSEAVLFGRWKPIRLSVEVTPSASVMFAGAYVMGWSADPDEWLDNSVQSVQVASAMRPSASNAIHSRTTMVIPSSSLQKWYLTDTSSGDPDSIHGKLYVVMSAPVSNIEGKDASITLLVKLNWEVEFESPTLPRASVRAGTIYADSGYESYFTDSVSTWADGKKLTLKAKEGGSAVTFTGAVAGTVYSIDPSAKLKYQKDASTMGRIRYGVPIPNFSNGLCLAVFDDLGRAKAFSKAGDSAYCLDYHAAGPTVSPTSPAWTAVTTVTQTGEAKLREEVAELRQMVAQLLTQQQPSTSTSDFEVLPRSPLPF